MYMMLEIKPRVASVYYSFWLTKIRTVIKVHGPFIIIRFSFKYINTVSNGILKKRFLHDERIRLPIDRT